MGRWHAWRGTPAPGNGHPVPTPCSCTSSWVQAEASPQRCQAPHQHHRGKEGAWARGAGCGPLPGSGSEPWAGWARAGRREVAVGGVRHCFIDVQKLPNKEAQVGPELPEWLGGHGGVGILTPSPKKLCSGCTPAPGALTSPHAGAQRVCRGRAGAPAAPCWALSAPCRRCWGGNQALPTPGAAKSSQGSWGGQRGCGGCSPHRGCSPQPCPWPGLCRKVLGIGVPPAAVLAAPRLLGVLSAPGTAPINERPLLSPALHSHGADSCLILRHPSPGWGHGAGEVGGTTVGPWGCWWGPEVGGGGWGLGWKGGQSRNSPGAAGSGALRPPAGPALSPCGGGCQHR